MNLFFGKKIACALLAVVLLAGCSAAKETTSASTTTEKQAETTTTEKQTEATTTTKAEETTATTQAPTDAPKQGVKFILPLWNPSSEDHFKELEFAARVKAAIPNLDVEFEVLKETDYESTMKIRNQSGELPDVFPVQQKWLLTFKDALTPIDDLDATKTNLYAQENKVDGKVIGLPYSRFGEVVFYHKSIFSEYNLTAPKTWDEFLTLCTTIKDGKKYIPLIMGAKDSWVDYPFNEFMPPIVAKNGDYYSAMATMDEPFTAGQPMYDSYAMIQKLYDAKVMGDDPLGIGFDQSKAMFAAKQGAMIAAGEWLLGDLSTALAGDTSDLSTFILPVRQNATDELITAGSVEEFWGINNKTENMDEAKALLNFMFNKDLWYSDHINVLNLGPTVKDVTLANPDPVFQEAFSTPNLKYIIYKAGDQNFMTIRDSIKFDVKELGVQMMMKSNLDGMMSDLNKNWKAARATAGIK